ncbi:hypothetical protein BGZ59_007089 [Podila verticillata]|nr:hypothetical protein BGZ59_007089 [Podila verticillata]
MTTQFTLKAESTSESAKYLMIVLNPNSITKQERNYKDYFPVAWKFKPSPIEVEYKKQDLVVMCQEMKSGNVVASADSQEILKRGEIFSIQMQDDMQRVMREDSHVDDHTAVIRTDLNVTTIVGLGSSARAFLTVPVPPKESISCTYDVEFAIVPVKTNVSEGTQQTQGVYHKLWFFFRLKDVKDPMISFTYGGSELKPKGFTVKEHKSSSPVFGNKSTSEYEP